MARLLVLYKQPADPAAFDRYYTETHIPLARKIPGLRWYVVSSGGVGLIAGGETTHLVAELEFDSMADLQSAMGSAEGQAAAADVANFADGGVTILAFDTKSV
jgi:uncharacterized protein (TIGR02118 family)